VAVGGRGHPAGQDAVAVDRLVVVGESVGIGQGELDQPALDACLLLPEQGVAAGETAGLVPGHGEAQAGSSGVSPAEMSWPQLR
jgi:hypothetical protein